MKDAECADILEESSSPYAHILAVGLYTLLDAASDDLATYDLSGCSPIIRGSWDQLAEILCWELVLGDRNQVSTPDAWEVFCQDTSLLGNLTFVFKL